VGASLCATLFLLEARNVMFLVAMLLRRDQERTLLMPKGDALVGLGSEVFLSVLSKGLAFHHVGFACTDLDAEERVFACFGYTREGPDFHDSVQGVHGRFLANGGPRLELLSELPGSVVLAPFLRRNIRMYHVAYEAADFRAANAAVAALGATCVVPPVSAVAFAGRMISFYMLPNGFLLELIEATGATLA
jgi:methylmalonyl-CoA/ethylmalonyl-CoA epimerase